MKTARHLIYEIETILNTDEGEAAIKAYAIECAKKALKAASDKATASFKEGSNGVTYSIDKQSITSTPINTP